MSFKIYYSNNNNNNSKISNNLSFIRLLSNESFMSIGKYFINYIEVLTCSNNANFKINISDNMVYENTLNNEEDHKTFYLFSVNIPVIRNDLIEIISDFSLSFRLYLGTKKVLEKEPIIKSIPLSEYDKEHNIFTLKNIPDLLDDIFD